MEIKPLVKDDYITIQKDETLSSLLGLLKKANKRNALVFDKNKFLGIVEDKWLIKSNLNPRQAKISKLIKRIPLVEENLDLVEAAYIMFQSNLNFLPVISHKQLSGVVYGLDLIKEASALEPIRESALERVKLVKNLKLRSQDTVASALSLLFKERIEQIPLVDEKGRLEGIISFRDFLWKYFLSPATRVHGFRSPTLSGRAATPDRPEIDKLPLASFSTTSNVITVPPKEKLTHAIELMHQHNLTDLIVVEDEKPLGLLTLKNILRKIASLQVPQNFNLRFINLEKIRLENWQKDHLRKIASQEAAKIQREIKNDFRLSIHFKEHKKEGRKQKYSVHLKLEYPGQLLVSGKDLGSWEVETALHKAFAHIQNRLKSKFRGDSSRRKPYE